MTKKSTQVQPAYPLFSVVGRIWVRFPDLNFCTDLQIQNLEVDLNKEMVIQ